MTNVRRSLLALGIVAVAACSADAVTPQATVHFVLVAPLCSSRLPVQFSIDSVPVGTDTFLVNLTPAHTTSAGFGTSGGVHTLGARVVNGYVWPDRTVTIASGAVFLDSLPYYCS